MKATKIIVQYIKGSLHLSIKYFDKNSNSVVWYNDSKWVEIGDEEKSPSRYVFCLIPNPIL